MPLQTGTYSLADLASIENRSAAELGLDSILPAIEGELATVNATVNAQLADLARETTAAEEAWGGASDGRFQKLDDFGRGATQRTAEPGRVGFPLEKYGFPVSWTRDFFYQATPRKVAETVRNVTTNYQLLLQSLIAAAIFTPVNTTVKDRFDTQLTLTVRAFLNADGQPIPRGQANQSFTAATHTHYLATAALTAADARALITTLIEHGHGAGVRVYISASNYAAWAALAGFVALTPATLVPANNAIAAVGALDMTETANRQVGFFDGYPVYTRSWIPANYVFAFAANDPRKPLVRRIRKESMLRGLRLESSEKAHPLYVDQYETYVGFAPGERTNGVAMFTGGAAYVAPTIVL